MIKRLSLELVLTIFTLFVSAVSYGPSAAEVGRLLAPFETFAVNLYVDNPADLVITNDVGAAGLSPGDTVTWNPGAGSSHAGPVAGLTYGTNAFGTIQSAVAASVNGDTINVGPGVFVENLLINKDVTMLGNNFSVNPNTGSRGPETVIVPSTSGGPVNGGPGPVVVKFTVGGLTFTGFTVDGDNPALTSGVIFNGVDVDAQYGIYGSETINPDALINYNIVRNIGEYGIWLNAASTGGAKTASLIADNKVDNIIGRFGQGIRVDANAWTAIQNNTLTRVRNGIVMENFDGTVTSHPSPLVSGNDVTSFRIGIRHNNHYIYTGPGYIIDNNRVQSYAQTIRPPQVTAVEAPVTSYQGIRVESTYSTIEVVVTNNVVKGNKATMLAAGYIRIEGLLVTDVFNITASPFISFTGNRVTDFIRGAMNETKVIPNFQCNTFSENNTGIYASALAITGLKANFNNIAGNGFGLQNDSAAVVDAENNYWGSPKGPGGVGPGPFDGVSTNVDYMPFLIDQSQCAPVLSADAAITKTDNLTSVNPGQPVSYTIAVTNPGTIPIPGKLSDAIPASLTNVTWTCSGTLGSFCSPTNGTGSILADADVAGGGTVTYTINGTVGPQAAGTISNTATVTMPASYINLSPNNDSATDTDTVVSADLAITKIDQPDPVQFGGNIIYTVTATNNGPSSAQDVVITDVLPIGAVFVSATPSNGTAGNVNGTVTNNVGTLTSGSLATLTIIIKSAGAPATTVSNTASVSSSSFDPNTGNNQATATTLVAKSDSATLIVTSNPNPSVVGQNYTVVYTVTAAPSGSGTPTGNVTVTDGVNSCTATVAAGQCVLPSASAGPKTLTATYSGDGNFNPSSGQAAHTVNPASVTTSLTASPIPPVFGQPVTLTGKITVEAPGAGTPGGTLTVYVDGIAYCNDVPVAADGTVICTLGGLPALGTGSHSVIVTYSGDANFMGSSSQPLILTVTIASSTTTVSSSVNPSIFGQPVTFTSTTTGAGTPTGTVTFTVDGNSYCPNTPVNGFGQASCLYTGPVLAPGNHPVTAAYSGDSNFTPSSGQAQQTVNQAPTATSVTSSQNISTAGQPVTFTAAVTVPPPGAGSPTGSVTFFVDGNPYCVSTVLTAGGISTCTLSGPPSLGAGTHTVTARYNGDPNFLTSISPPITQTVAAGSSTTTVSSSVNPSVYGQPVTFSSQTTAPGTPTGTVTFTVDGANYCSNTPVNASGQATCPYSGPVLAVGNHAVTATYNGDINFGPSTGLVTQVVAKANTTTTITSSANPSNPGDAVTFTSTTVAVAPGAGPPLGTATFTVDGNQVCFTAVSFLGQAVCTVPGLTPGNHIVTVTYNGDANFNGSGATLAGGQVVNSPLEPGFESDVAPRPSGDGSVATADVIQMRRFVANLDPAPVTGTTATTNEFQRADAAPRATLGNGVLDAGDIIQSRRYAGALDPMAATGGPTAPIALPAAAKIKSVGKTLGVNAAEAQARTMRVTSAETFAGSKVSVDVELDARGDELATSFTLYFDAMKLCDPQVTLGKGASSDAVLTVNTSNAAGGRVIVVVDAGDAMMSANASKLVNITFDVAPNAVSGNTQISFGSDPTAAVISDALGNEIEASYEAGTITISGAGTGVEISGRVTTPDGAGLRGARVVLTDRENHSAVVTTSANGYYTFTAVAAANTYTVTVASKRFRFEPKTIKLTDSIADLNFIAQE